LCAFQGALELLLADLLNLPDHLAVLAVRQNSLGDRIEFGPIVPLSYLVLLFTQAFRELAAIAREQNVIASPSL
jgi:hypothetical protein